MSNSNELGQAFIGCVVVIVLMAAAAATVAGSIWLVTMAWRGIFG